MHKNFLTESGSRDTQELDREDRDWIYKHEHRKLHKDLLVTDVDQIEYRTKGETVIPVAVIELKRADINLHSFKHTTRKGLFETNQPYALMEIAKRIRVPCFLVCYFQEWTDRMIDGKVKKIECITAFSVCKMGKKNPWCNMKPSEYVEFLENLEDLYGD